MKKRLLSLLTLALTMLSGLSAATNGIPDKIQDGNILHCFNWPASVIKAELPKIAAAGFGSIQLSPLQRPDINVSGTSWHDLYRPYDLAFKPSNFCSEADLKALCTEAAKYGIKIIVDVVANHVDKTSGYHDTWWDSNGRVRWNGGIDYNNRYSITHGQLGDYGDVNSEDAQVIARAKAYIEKLKSLGVKGIRWDAAKHIGLPSEGCNFWKEVTSVSGMWHYGEILDAPGPNSAIIKEYAQYMSVTDNRYCNNAARSNGGLASGYGGEWVVNQGLSDSKLVYWAESHDTYSNDEWSQNVGQDVIDRAYACYATRNGATALYLARPNTKGFGNIKTGKGSTAYQSKHITEVNNFRNAMVGRADYFSTGNNAVSITRKDGGAVIVMKGSGNVSITNGGGYCPAGTYTDRVSGGKFTVTSTTISGNVGSSGIAVLMKDGIGPDPNPNPDPDPDPDPDPNPGTAPAKLYIMGNLAEGSWKTNVGITMTKSGNKFVANNVNLKANSGETYAFFTFVTALGTTGDSSEWDGVINGSDRYGATSKDKIVSVGGSADMQLFAAGVNASSAYSWGVTPGTYTITADFSTMKVTISNGNNPNPDPNPDPNPSGVTIYYDNTATNWATPYIYYWDVDKPAWPGVAMSKHKGNVWVYTCPAGTTGCIFNAGDGDASKSEDFVAQHNHIYTKAGGDQGVYSDPDPDPDPDPKPDPDPDPNPDPTPDGNMWILGNLDGAGWGNTPGVGVSMSKNGNVYTANGVVFAAANGETVCYFNITDYVGSTWDDLNQNANRYGAATEGEAIKLGTPATVVAYPNNVSASGCLSWSIAPGKYNLTFDKDAMTLLVTSGDASIDVVGVDTSVPAVYYDLFGRRVNNPAKGTTVIRVDAAGATKIRF